MTIPHNLQSELHPNKPRAREQVVSNSRDRKFPNPAEGISPPSITAAILSCNPWFFPSYRLSKNLLKTFSFSIKLPHAKLDICKKCQLTAKIQLKKQKISIIGLSPVSRCTWMPPDSFTPSAAVPHDIQG